VTAWRLPNGGEIDRTNPLSFSFDGRAVNGFEGDTIASALLASNVGIVGRSFKYHRPRGVWGAGVEEPNAIVDVLDGPKPAPNVRATTEKARHGTIVRSVNNNPSAEKDRNAFIDRFARFIPAAFYYKTFMVPGWHVFEPRIRKMAGLGMVRPDQEIKGHAEQVNHHCDVLVIGAGPAGLVAALKAAEAGLSVLLCDERSRPGGSLLFRGGVIDGREAKVWVEEAAARLRQLGVTTLVETTAFGIYDHNLVALNQRHGDNRLDTLCVAWHLNVGMQLFCSGYAFNLRIPMVRFSN
jgi:sarcosine oxidase subunit alpha